MGTRTGFVIVGVRPERFEALAARVDDLRALAAGAAATDLARTLADYPQCRAERVVASVTVETIRRLEARATERGFARQRSLTSFWRLDARTIDTADDLVARLARVDSVERAYPELSGSDPLVNAADDVFAGLQRHLDPAPVGIDARWAWTQTNGSGALVGFVDLEQGWNFDHEDLPPIVGLPGVSQDVKPSSVGHGTGVMGLAVGRDNAVGIIGVAPTPAWVSVASHYRAIDQTEGHVADAIVALLASGGLSEGDVLLIEYQDSNNGPIETDPVVWNAIELATALGVVVIEAAGNGNVDLDTIPALNRLDPSTFLDSRAVIVGGAMSALDAAGVGHDRWVHPVVPAGSNFGSRVDCHAYAESVVTAGSAATPSGVLGGTGSSDAYRSDFGGTSAAAAIVAGAAVVLQGMNKAIEGAPLTPVQLREALSTHGTPQGSGRPGHIGMMPDLKGVAHHLGLVESDTSAPAPPTNLRLNRA